MSAPGKYDNYEAVESHVTSDYDHVGGQMRRRDEYLTRNLRRVRIFARILDVGFGYVSFNR